MYTSLVNYKGKGIDRHQYFKWYVLEFKLQEDSLIIMSIIGENQD